MCKTAIFFGEELSRYNFGQYHPFDSDRIYAFWSKFKSEKLYESNQFIIEAPVLTDEQTILSFHDRDYVELVKKASKHGRGFLDTGDTPAFEGVFEASCYVVGSTLKALEVVMENTGGIDHAFNPIGGLHHSRRDSAGGFCVFNDIGIAIMEARKKYGIKRIAYVDIDAHHGDGVFYEFEEDPLMFFCDIHEDGKFLYPGSGSQLETGLGRAEGTKLNVPMPPNSTDRHFVNEFKKIEEFIEKIAKPELIILQCGADSLSGDPITHLCYTSYAHKYATDSLHRLAHSHCNGRIVALGGGGYNKTNIADAWTTVVKSLI
ncbi:MAG: acetoin utilization protein AcuC [Nitrososphaeraceae archaeon]|jgi:acetoin utilization protein AcuC